MTQVTVTGNVYSHGRAPIAASLQPRLWFRPDKPHMAVGLQDSRGVLATLNATTGAFSVEIESFPGVRYIPTLEYLRSADDTYAKGAFGFEEWPMFYPGSGGDISALSSFVGSFGLLFGFGAPPSELSNVIYIDITGPAIRIYGPTGGNI
jgi:hypothetical protein